MACEIKAALKLQIVNVAELKFNCRHPLSCPLRGPSFLWIRVIKYSNIAQVVHTQTVGGPMTMSMSLYASILTGSEME